MNNFITSLLFYSLPFYISFNNRISIIQETSEFGLGYTTHLPSSLLVSQNKIFLDLKYKTDVPLRITKPLLYLNLDKEARLIGYKNFCLDIDNKLFLKKLLCNNSLFIKSTLVGSMKLTYV